MRRIKNLLKDYLINKESLNNYKQKYYYKNRYLKNNKIIIKI